MEIRDPARFEFNMIFGRISYIAIVPKLGNSQHMTSKEVMTFSWVTPVHVSGGNVTGCINYSPYEIYIIMRESGMLGLNNTPR